LTGSLLIGSSVIAWQSSAEHRKLVLAYDKTIRMLRFANQAKQGTLNTLRGERGFLLTGRAADLKPFFVGRTELLEALDNLEENARGSTEHRAAIALLRTDVNTYLARLAEIVDTAREGRHEAALAAVREGEANDAISRIDRTTDALLRAERDRLHAISEHARQVTANQRLLMYLMSVAGLCLVLLTAPTAVALRRSSDRERRYRDELQEQAQTDDLTGIYNRRQLLESLEEAIRHARQTRRPLSFAIFDIDHFKDVNDSHGHAAGDEAIRQIAQLATGAVRANDILGRMGGEEFGIVIPNAEEAHAYAVCERLRQRIRSETFRLGAGIELRMTISSGVAGLTDDDTAASLIERADKALYVAKGSGRDQVKRAA